MTAQVLFFDVFSEKDPQDYITMIDLNKVILCLDNIKGKNLGQNTDNLAPFLIKDFGCEKEDGC